MKEQTPKTVNALMAYMRDSKGIQIRGTTQKKKLRYMGYFHGYKGYRYHGNPANQYNYSNFGEIQSVYDFDMSLKTTLYPKIMFLETTLKNYALEVILDQTKSKRFADIYSNLLTDYKLYPKGSKKYKNAINKRLNLRNKVYSAISRDYGKRFVVSHYYDKDQPLPIWAIFEIISLGEFANFLDCLDESTKKSVSKLVGINGAVDRDGKLLPIMVYALKDLRNAVAHNNTIFDTRFNTGKISKRLGNYIEAETGITNITFDTIVDYIILISFIMQLLKCPKTEILTFVRNFENNCEVFRRTVATPIYTSVVYTDTRNKLITLKKWL